MTEMALSSGHKLDASQIMSTSILQDQTTSVSVDAQTVAKSAINIAVQPIDNGFIVRISIHPYENPKEIYIATLEDLPDVLTAQIAANKIGV